MYYLSSRPNAMIKLLPSRSVLVHSLIGPIYRKVGLLYRMRQSMPPDNARKCMKPLSSDDLLNHDYSYLKLLFKCCMC